jgi:hypothetical protein
MIFVRYDFEIKFYLPVIIFLNYIISSIAGNPNKGTCQELSRERTRERNFSCNTVVSTLQKSAFLY